MTSVQNFSKMSFFGRLRRLLLCCSVGEREEEEPWDPEFDLPRPRTYVSRPSRLFSLIGTAILKPFHIQILTFPALSDQFWRHSRPPGILPLRQPSQLAHHTRRQRVWILALPAARRRARETTTPDYQPVVPGYGGNAKLSQQYVDHSLILSSRSILLFPKLTYQ